GAGGRRPRPVGAAASAAAGPRGPTRRRAIAGRSAMSAAEQPGGRSPRFSVVIPTYRRRDRVLRNVRALAEQSLSDFEAIVVDDGSDDGSAAALRGLETPFPLAVLEQENQGAAGARNVGARAARGEIPLFLDDDMEAAPSLLAEHDRSHLEGADLVVGDMPLHPASPAG